MERVFKIFGVVAFVAILSSFTYTSIRDRHTIDVREVNVSGHKYVVASSYYDGGTNRPGGVAIVHSESCYCRNNRH